MKFNATRPCLVAVVPMLAWIAAAPARAVEDGSWWYCSYQDTNTQAATIFIFSRVFQGAEGSFENMRRYSDAWNDRLERRHGATKFLHSGCTRNATEQGARQRRDRLVQDAPKRPSFERLIEEDWTPEG